MRILIAVFVCFLITAPVPAQQLQFADLGDFKLEGGDVIRGCRIGFRSFGRLNAERSNVILFLPWFEGTTKDIAALIPLLDLGKYYVIALDALGNGVSSSPSNSRRQPRMSFPQFTVRDMIETEREILQHRLGINHVRAVMGISIGAFQTFQWMVSYPDFMDYAIPMFGAPRLDSYSLLYFRLGMDLITADSGWKGGNYDARPAQTTSAELAGLMSFTPEYFNAHVSRDQLFQQLAAFAASTDRSDANDRIRQTQALLNFDVSAHFGGSMERAASSVHAKALIVVSRSDHAVTPGPALEFAELTHARTLVLRDDCGHNAIHCELAEIAGAVHDLLEDTGRHGASESRPIVAQAGAPLVLEAMGMSSQDGGNAETLKMTPRSQ